MAEGAWAPAPYGQSLALLTDLYQLTMANGYWSEGLADREAVFVHYFRRAPFGGSFAVAAGLDTALQWLGALRFRPDDIDYLGGLVVEGGRPLFDPGFLDYLAGLRFECDVDAVAEGTAVFAGEPMARVRGPLLQCQLAETALLNIVNFQTLVATKAARVCRAAGDDAVLEFGLRRAQGIDGGLSASRAAYVGGCAATSNVLAGKLYGIPVRGTHAHSWVLAFDSEPEAFEAYARVMPHNCVLLVDTYDTRRGIRRAVDVGVAMKERGARLAGIRLDSGDLAQLSREARLLLDAAGLGSTAVVASNELDERSIKSLRNDGARIGVWGVGTSIAAAKDDAALGGVYKLALIRDGDGSWQHKAKLSEDPAKASMPGMLQVRRYRSATGGLRDLIVDDVEMPQGPQAGIRLERPDDGRADTFEGAYEDLLEPVARHGRRVRDRESLDAARERCKAQLDRLPREYRGPRRSGPSPVYVERVLWNRHLRFAGGAARDGLG